MNSSVGGCGGGEVEGVRSGRLVSRCGFVGSGGAYLLQEQLASWNLLQREG